MSLVSLANLLAIFHGLVVVPTVMFAPLLLLFRSLLWLEVWFLICALPTGYYYATGRECPLTLWEQQLRLTAGGPSYPGGFLQHYLGRLGIDLPTTYAADPIVILVVIGTGIVAWRLFWRIRRQQLEAF